MAKKPWKPTLASDRLTPVEKLRLLRERAESVAAVLPRMFEGGYWGIPGSEWLGGHFERLRRLFLEFSSGGDGDAIIEAVAALRAEAGSRGFLKGGSLATYWIMWVASEANMIDKASDAADYTVDYDF